MNKILITDDGHYMDLDKLKRIDRLWYIITGRFFRDPDGQIDITGKKFRGRKKGDLILITKKDQKQ